MSKNTDIAMAALGATVHQKATVQLSQFFSEIHQILINKMEEHDINPGGERADIWTVRRALGGDSNTSDYDRLLELFTQKVVDEICNSKGRAK